MLRLSDSPSSPSVPNLRYYGAYGVSISSELPLPLPEVRRETGPALLELEIRAFNEPLSAFIPEEVTLQHNRLSGFDVGFFPDGSIYARWDDVGEALISRTGRSIACRSFPRADSESFYVYLLGQALSLALVKGGFEPLHATAVAVGERAIAFLGDCGLGKSTLAASFLQAGHRLLTDDLLLLHTTTRGILAYPGPARIKLFPEIANNFLRTASSGVTLNPKTQKLIIPLDRNQVCVDPAPLAKIYVLSPSDDIANRDIRIVPLTERQSFLTLLGSTFNRVIVDADRLRRHFEATQTLGNGAIVSEVSYPRYVESLPLVRKAILSDLYVCESAILPCNT